MILLEDSPTFTLWHDSTCACLCATWQGYHDSSLMQAHYLLIQQHVRATGSIKLLNDSIADKDGWDQVADWIAHTCFERLADDGLQVVAWVLPHHPNALYDTARVIKQLRRPIVDTFLDAQAAYDWLHQWPFGSPALPPVGFPVGVVEFLLLLPNEQMKLIEKFGCPLAPRYEAEFYVKPYHVGEGLLVESYYYIHSGIFYQIKAFPVKQA